MTQRALSWLVCGVAWLHCSGCDTRQAFEQPRPGWERMMQQRRADPFAKSSVFADGRVMQSPAPGSVPRERAHLGHPSLQSGREVDGYLSRVPLAVDLAFLQLGRSRFEQLCAACHGVLGDGVSVVAQKMTLRAPPSLQEPRIAQLPAGRVFEVISQGYGLMPGYDAVLEVDERWAVVAYLDALRDSQRAPIASLSPSTRAKLKEAAP